MPLRISGKNINIGEALRTHVSERLNAATGKYFDGSVAGHVTIEPEGSGYRTDCTLHLASASPCRRKAARRKSTPASTRPRRASRAACVATSASSRIATAPSAKPRAKGEPIRYTVFSAPDEVEDAPSEHEFKPAVVAGFDRLLQKLSVSAAVLELDLTGAPVLAFRHATSDRVNVIYRRLDGNIGWIDPTGGEKGSA